jgi:hypothetical protein
VNKKERPAPMVVTLRRAGQDWLSEKRDRSYRNPHTISPRNFARQSSYTVKCGLNHAQASAITDDLHLALKREAQQAITIGRLLIEANGTSLPEVHISKPEWPQVCIKFYQGLAQCTGTKLYFVSSLDRVNREALLHAGVRSRLLSYADLKNKRSGVIESYFFERRCFIAEIKDAKRAAKARRCHE